MYCFEELLYPCATIITAVRGYNGQELYRLTAHHSVLALNCEALDINRDGQADCVATGRSGTLTAFDSKNGRPKIKKIIEKSSCFRQSTSSNVLSSVVSTTAHTYQDKM